MRRCLLRQVLLLTAASSAVAAQSGRQPLIVVSPALLQPAESENISCSSLRADEALQVQRQYLTRSYTALADPLPKLWQVTLVESGRIATLKITRAYHPREILVLVTHPRSAGGQQESVRVRFLPDGQVQDGHRAVTPRRQNGRFATPVFSPLDSSDGEQLYALARELAFRCERAVFEPVPAGSIQRQVPPN